MREMRAWPIDHHLTKRSVDPYFFTILRLLQDLAGQSYRRGRSSKGERNDDSEKE
jgi:hypothetical protein